MTVQRRIITRHMVERTALHELGRLFTIQAAALAGDPEAASELKALGLTPTTRLERVHERKAFYKWCVIAS